MTFLFSNFIAKAQSSEPLTAADLIALRQGAWRDSVISDDEAEALFALNDNNSVQSSAWADMFVGALTSYLVYQKAPRGYVDEANAAWLISHIEKDGKIDSMSELALLVHVLEAATSAPDSLRSFAVRAIEQAVFTGQGPTRHGGEIRPGVIDEAEVTLLRRLIFAPAGNGGLVVGKDEAEMLFRIKDATLGADNAGGWELLFVQGVANHLMALGNDPVPTAERALQSEKFWKSPAEGKLTFLGQMVSSMLSPVSNYRQFKDEFSKREESADEHEARVDEANEVTPEETGWVRAYMEADQYLDPLEKALIAFVEAEGGKIS